MGGWDQWGTSRTSKVIREVGAPRGSGLSGAPPPHAWGAVPRSPGGAHLAVHELEVDALQGDLQQPPLPRLHVLDGALSAQLRAWGHRGRGQPSCSESIATLIKLDLNRRYLSVRLAVGQVPPPTWLDALLPGRRLLHAVLHTVVQLPTLGAQGTHQGSQRSRLTTRGHMLLTEVTPDQQRSHLTNRGHT